MLTAALLATPLAAAETPDLEALGACADRAWKDDVAAWAGYAFDRHVVLRDLNRNGEETARKERRFRMTPKGGGFDERLISEDGRAATPSEIEEFRRKANFTRNYRGAEELEFSNPLGENLMLMRVLKDQEYKLVGQREVNGIPCYQLVFYARPEPRRASSEKQLLHATQGSTCISLEGCHVVRLELETVRPIRQRLARIDYMRVTVDGQPLEDGWVANRVEARFDFAMLGRQLRRYTTYRYSNYRRHGGRR